MKYPKNEFKPFTYELLELVRGWRNEPRIRNNMYSTDIIGRDQQVEWFEKMVEDPSREYFVYFQNDKPIGCLSFTSINNEDCQWGCYLGEERVWPGSGIILAVAALDYAFKGIGVEALEAEVLEFNKSPQQMHQTFEYPESYIKETNAIRDGKQVNAIVYKYSREAWEKNRDNVLDKFPIKFRHAANQIFFKGKLLS